MGAKSARKGKVFERLVAGLLREAGFDGAKRGIGQARSGGEVADVQGLEGWWVECKHGGCSPQAALEQARDAVKGVARVRRKRCARCGGKGTKPAATPCDACKGTGLGRPTRPRKVEPKSGLLPVAITRSTGGPILATVDLAVFVDLVRDRRTLHEVTDKVAAKVEAEPAAYQPDPWKDIVP